MSTYTELFSISIIHDYYTDGMCPDFSIVPTPECLEILNGHYINMKNKATGVQLVIRTDGDAPFIDISDVAKFSFYMILDESAFGNYTTLTEIEKNEIYCFDNQSITSGELNSTVIEKSGISLPVNDAAVFAIIDIYPAHLADLEDPSQYTISFTATETNWSYYFITNQSDDETSVYHQELTFTEDIAANDPIGQELEEKYPDSDIRLYRSESEISYREQGRKNIEFRVAEVIVGKAADVLKMETRETGPEITLIEHLPNPGIYDNGIKILKVTI